MRNFSYAVIGLLLAVAPASALSPFPKCLPF
jgi:hypothetical protein